MGLFDSTVEQAPLPVPVPVRQEMAQLRSAVAALTRELKLERERSSHYRSLYEKARDAHRSCPS